MNDRNAVATKVRVPKSAELVANQLRRQIVRGELAEGDSLPSETTLMEMFGVSRPTLREAFRVLESQSLISVFRGARGGARVHAPQVSVASGYAGLLLQSQATTLEDVYHARMALECSAILLLAQSSSKAALASLKDTLEREGESLESPKLFLTCAGQFHSQLVTATGNHTLSLLTLMLEGVIERHVEVSSASVAQEGAARSYARAHRVHQEVLEHIEAGDAVQATELWTRHARSSIRAIKTENLQTVLDLFE